MLDSFQIRSSNCWVMCMTGIKGEALDLDSAIRSQTHNA